MTPEGNLCFCRYEDIDWDASLPKGAESLEGDELLMYRELARRGASFLKFLTSVPKEDSAQEVPAAPGGKRAGLRGQLRAGAPVAEP